MATIRSRSVSPQDARPQRLWTSSYKPSPDGSGVAERARLDGRRPGRGYRRAGALTQGRDPVLERRVGVDHPVDTRPLLACSLASVTCDRRLGPQVCGGLARGAYDGLVLLQLLESPDQTVRVARDHHRLSIREELALARD